jgi:hypothetical protein
MATDITFNGGNASDLVMIRRAIRNYDTIPGFSKKFSYEAQRDSNGKWTLATHPVRRSYRPRSDYGKYPRKNKHQHK